MDDVALVQPRIRDPRRPAALGQDFVAGNDADAKKAVIDPLRSFGHTDIIDLGDITNARRPEMLLPIWVRLMGALNTQNFNFKIVR